MSNSRHAVKVLVFVLILVFYASISLHQIRLPAGDDLARHIKNGEMVMQGNFDVLYQNVYSYTEPNQSFTNHHWLSGVVFYLLHESIGFDGLVIFKTVILLLAFSLLFLAATKKADFWLVAVFSIPTILILRERTDLRPEIFSFLFVAIFLYLLLDLEENPKRNRIFLLIPIQLIWVNMHIFFIAGVLLVAGFLFEKFIRAGFKSNLLVKKLTVLLVVLAAVCFINPHGINLFYFKVNFLGDFPITIQEEQSLSSYLKDEPLWDDVSVAIFIPALVLLASSFIIGFKRKMIFYLLASAGTAMLSFSIISRGLAFFGLMFLPAVSVNFDEAYNKIGNRIKRRYPMAERATGRVMIAVLILVLSILILLGSLGKISKFRKPGIGLTSMSNSSALFFKEHNLKGPIFNDTDIGSYLIFQLFPEEKVFADNRFGDAYSLSFFNDTYLSLLNNDKKWQEMSERYGFNVIFLYRYDDASNFRKFLYERMNDSSWVFVYADTYSVIFLKNTEGNMEVIEKFKITTENIGERLKYLVESSETEDQVAAADLFSLMDRYDLAIDVFKKVVTNSPKNGRVWMIMGELKARKDDTESARLSVTYLKNAIVAGQKTAEVYSFLGLAYYRLGEIDKAKEALGEALRINPEREDSKNLLDIIEKLHPTQ